MIGAAHAAHAFARTLLRARRLRTRNALEAWQARRMARWLTDTMTVPAHAALRDAITRDGLAALPVLDKEALRAGFAGYNRLGLDAATAMAMADGHLPPPPGHSVGASTGTSGARMPYLVSDVERFVWLGTLLAKAIARDVLRRPRVAVVLPRGSALYDAANLSRALPLRFVPIGDGMEAMARKLEGFAPQVIVAPPRALRWLVETRACVSPRWLFSAAEVLDPPDRAVIGRGFPGASLGQIYMATEGLFAVTCRFGTLHLAEDCVHFEWEEAGGGLVSPIVTDFTRRAQVMARFRMNDLLRLGPPCACGSPLQAVAAVEGRRDDAFEVGGHVITPDVLRDAVLAAATGIDDFRLVQTGPMRACLTLPPHLSAEVAHRAASAVEAAVARAGGRLAVEVERAPLASRADRKLRRVERRWFD